MADQGSTPLLVGDRISATGSRRAAALLRAGDYAGIVSLAQEQLQAGAWALDISVAELGLSDEIDRICAVLARLRRAVPVPLVIDSIDPDVQLVALRMLGFRAIVNSVNLQQGAQPFAAVLATARELGAGVVVQTIDERGMARTAEDKLRVATRAVRMLSGRYGLAPEAIIVDPLLFPVHPFPLRTSAPSSMNAAMETLEGIRRITSELAPVRTILGLSNGSFGMPARARPLLESVLLHHAAESGLDLALVSPSHIAPYDALPERALAEDVVFARGPDALARYLAYFDESADEPAGER